MILIGRPRRGPERTHPRPEIAARHRPQINLNRNMNVPRYISGMDALVGCACRPSRPLPPPGSGQHDRAPLSRAPAEAGRQARRPARSLHRAGAGPLARVHTPPGRRTPGPRAPAGGQGRAARGPHRIPPDREGASRRARGDAPLHRRPSPWRCPPSRIRHPTDPRARVAPPHRREAMPRYPRSGSVARPIASAGCRLRAGCRSGACRRCRSGACARARSTARAHRRSMSRPPAKRATGSLRPRPGGAGRPNPAGAPPAA